MISYIANYSRGSLAFSAEVYIAIIFPSTFYLAHVTIYYSLHKSFQTKDTVTVRAPLHVLSHSETNLQSKCQTNKQTYYIQVTPLLNIKLHKTLGELVRSYPVQYPVQYPWGGDLKHHVLQINLHVQCITDAFLTPIAIDLIAPIIALCFVLLASLAFEI